MEAECHTKKCAALIPPYVLYLSISTDIIAIVSL